jgi:hypothetical protein
MAGITLNEVKKDSRCTKKPSSQESVQSLLWPHLGQLTLQTFFGNSSPQFSQSALSAQQPDAMIIN